MDAAGALAALCGSRVRYLLRRTVVSLGRSTDSHGPARSRPPLPALEPIWCRRTATASWRPPQ
jgi:hypothetical protein